MNPTEHAVINSSGFYGDSGDTLAFDFHIMYSPI